MDSRQYLSVILILKSHVLFGCAWRFFCSNQVKEVQNWTFTVPVRCQERLMRQGCWWPSASDCELQCFFTISSHLTQREWLARTTEVGHFPFPLRQLEWADTGVSLLYDENGYLLSLISWVKTPATSVLLPFSESGHHLGRAEGSVIFFFFFLR